MKEKDIKEILEIIMDKLQNQKFTWRLEGSANLKIQGIQTDINDLDITTDNEGIKIFRTALKEYITKDFFSEKIKGHSILCNINNSEVEINAYGDRKELNMFDKTKNIFWNSINIPISPLEYAKKFYELIDRKEKVKVISDFLKQ